MITEERKSGKMEGRKEKEERKEDKEGGEKEESKMYLGLGSASGRSNNQ